MVRVTDQAAAEDLELVSSHADPYPGRRRRKRIVATPPVSEEG